MKKFRLLTTLIHLSLLLAFLSSTISLAETFKIIGTAQKPFRYIENGVLKGIDVKILQLIMKEINISDYKIDLTDSGEKALVQAKRGRVDMLISYSKKKDRMVILNYPNQSYKKLTWNFFIRKADEETIKFENLSDLKKYQIGITKSFAYTEDFLKAVSKGELKVQEIAKNNLQITKLIQGRIDLVPMNTLATLYQEKESGRLAKLSYLPKPLKSKYYYNAFTKSSTYPNVVQVMKRYDAAIIKLIKDGSIGKVYKEYLSLVPEF